MDIKTYFTDVYYQFYNKVDEVDYFISLAIDNSEAYQQAPLPKDHKFFKIAQYTFSAFLSALESCWEIVKVTHDLYCSLHNSASSSITEKYLEDGNKFNQFFDITDSTAFTWYFFLKNARNASCHDGSLILKGSNSNNFCFSTDIHRYKKDVKSKEYLFLKYPSPTEDVITSILQMAVCLIPLFEKKLIKPDLTTEDHKKAVTYNLNSLKDPIFQTVLNSFDGFIKEEFSQAMTKSKAIIYEQKKSCDPIIENWKSKLHKFNS